MIEKDIFNVRYNEKTNTYIIKVLNIDDINFGFLEKNIKLKRKEFNVTIYSIIPYIKFEFTFKLINDIIEYLKENCEDYNLKEEIQETVEDTLFLNEEDDT